LIFLSEEDFNTEAKQLNNDENKKKMLQNQFQILQREVNNFAKSDECHV
jgi:hypothetical protein